MNIKKQLTMAKQLGFTLIELLIVMAIMAILISVMFASLVKGAQQKKEATETVALVTNIASTEYEALDVVGVDTYVDDTALCSTSAAADNQLSPYCTESDGSLGSSLSPPTGAIKVSATNNTQFVVTLSSQPKAVTTALSSSFPGTCITSSTPSTVDCTFDQSSASSDD